MTTPHVRQMEYMESEKATAWLLAKHLNQYTLTRISVSEDLSCYDLTFTKGRDQHLLTNYEDEVLKLFTKVSGADSHYIRESAKIRFTRDKMVDEVGRINGPTKTCRDCKGTRVYQPLIGPKEPCQTCT